MAETDKLNIDNIIARLLEGKAGRSLLYAGRYIGAKGWESVQSRTSLARLARLPLASPSPLCAHSLHLRAFIPSFASAIFLTMLSNVPQRFLLLAYLYISLSLSLSLSHSYACTNSRAYQNAIPIIGRFISSALRNVLENYERVPIDSRHRQNALVCLYKNAFISQYRTRTIYASSRFWFLGEQGEVLSSCQPYGEMINREKGLVIYSAEYCLKPSHFVALLFLRERFFVRSVKKFQIR